MVRGLADHGAVARDDELDLGEALLEPEADLALPGRMQMRVDFVC